jgi:hypothetical protein
LKLRPRMTRTTESPNEQYCDKGTTDVVPLSRRLSPAGALGGSHSNCEVQWPSPSLTSISDLHAFLLECAEDSSADTSKCRPISVEFSPPPPTANFLNLGTTQF